MSKSRHAMHSLLAHALSVARRACDSFPSTIESCKKIIRNYLLFRGHSLLVPRGATLRLQVYSVFDMALLHVPYFCVNHRGSGPAIDETPENKEFLFFFNALTMYMIKSYVWRRRSN